MKLDVLVRKKMLRRAQLATKPLFGCQRCLLFGVLAGSAYITPCKKVAVNAILAETVRFSFHDSGNGMMSMIAPVTTFGIVMYRSKATTSMQFPPWLNLFHS